MTGFRYVIECEVERVSGKFAPADEIEEKIGEACDEVESSIDVSGLGADGDSEYEVVSFSASAEDVCGAHRKGEPGRCALAPNHFGDHVSWTGLDRWVNRGRSAYKRVQPIEG